MNPYQTLKLQSLVIALLFILITLVGVQYFPPLTVILITASMAAVALSWRLFRAIHRKIEIQQFNVFRQVESLTGLYATLGIDRPLPRTRRWAASPDFLHLVAEEILRRKPKLIVEAGSGTSTLIAAYCLRKLGRGKIVSLDHLEEYAGISRETVESHGLGDYSEVLHAPIKEYEIEGKTYQWYDTVGLESIQQIDMLLVDGPPKNDTEDARYAAIPLLIKKLHKNSIVLVDDGSRPGEREIVAKWERNYGLRYRSELAEKGAFCCFFADTD